MILAIFDRPLHGQDQCGPVQGEGSVQSHINRLDVDLTAGDEVVLRYHWDEGLQASGNAELFPYEVAEGIAFIGLRPNGESQVTIRYKRFL